MYSRVTDTDRWQWVLTNPKSAVALFHLLAAGDKGSAQDLTKLVDRMIRAEQAASQKRPALEQSDG